MLAIEGARAFDEFERKDRHHDVDDRFRVNSGYRGTADVFDPSELAAHGRYDPVAFP